MFGTVGAAKHGYNALNMRNVFRKISRKEGDFAEEGEWRRVVELPLQFIVALNLIEPYNWHTIYCRPQQSVCGRTKLFSASCLTIYR